MRRKLILFILAGLLSLSVASCGSSVQDEPVVAPSQEESEKSEDEPTNSRDCSSIFENEAFSKSPTICGGILNILAISSI